MRPGITKYIRLPVQSNTAAATKKKAVASRGRRDQPWARR